MRGTVARGGSVSRRPSERPDGVGAGEDRMSEETAKLSGPDLTQGVELSTVPDGTMLLGHARGEPVLLARRGDELSAIGAVCTLYGADAMNGSRTSPLAPGYGIGSAAIPPVGRSFAAAMRRRSASILNNSTDCKYWHDRA